MIDSIVKEVREAKAAVAADFDYDLHKFFAWAKAHTAAEHQAKHLLPTNLNNMPKAAGETIWPANLQEDDHASG